MRNWTLLLIASGMLVACSAPTADPAAEPSDAATRASGSIANAGHSLAASSARDRAARAGAADPPGSSAERRQVAVTADTAAADAVLQLLEQEELLVLDLESSVRVGGDGSTVVLVRVLFGTGRSHPHQETYRVRLVEDAGRWTMMGLEAAA